MNKFNLHDQFQFFQKIAKLDERKMSKTQRDETKRAYMAGCSQILVLLFEQLKQQHDPEEITVPQLCAALCCACGKVAYRCCYALVWADLQHKVRIEEQH